MSATSTPLLAPRSPGETFLSQKTTRNDSHLPSLVKSDSTASNLGPPGYQPLEKHALQSISARVASSSRTHVSSHEGIEKLTWSANRVVWSKGSAVHRTFSFRRTDQVLQALFSTFRIPPFPTQKLREDRLKKDAGSTSTTGRPLFGPFGPAQPSPWTGENGPRIPFARAGCWSRSIRSNSRAVCILFRDRVVVTCESGRSFTVPFSFHPVNAHAASNGIIIVGSSGSRSASAQTISYLLEDPLVGPLPLPSKSRPPSPIGTSEASETLHCRPTVVLQDLSLNRDTSSHPALPLESYPPIRPNFASEPDSSSWAHWGLPGHSSMVGC
jgi:hypothetical protein